MEGKIRIAITQGDINGVGWEVVLKSFEDPTMLELCTPVIYGSPKVATYHRKTMDIQTSFSIISSATDAADDAVNIVSSNDDEAKVEFAKTDAEAGKAAWYALRYCLYTSLHGSNYSNNSLHTATILLQVPVQT